MTDYYTGVGHRARNVSPEGKTFILWLSAEMAKRDKCLVSGDADGSDEYFERNSGGNCCIYLPYHKFGHYEGRDMSTRHVLTLQEEMFADERLYTTGILPEIQKMSEHNKRYHRRNFFQSWNYEDFPKVCFYYAKENTDGTIEGGTRTAVYTARYYSIPCHNLYTEEGREIVRKLIEEGEWD